MSSEVAVKSTWTNSSLSAPISEVATFHNLMAKIANNKEHFLPFTDTQGIIIESTRPQKNRISQSDMEYSTIQTTTKKIPHTGDTNSLDP